jgi:hypothetical protein
VTLFDGGRWDRFRRYAWAGRWTRGRFTAWAEFANYELPLPKVWIGFEECEIAVGVSIGDALNDRLAALVFAVELPGSVADALVVVWPGRLARGARRAALSSLLADASQLLDATPKGTPTIREDP